jgi:choloylglycine hydrolase
MIRALTTAVLVSILVATGHTCSTFCVDLGGTRLFGRNYDFDIGDGFVTSNPAGLRKKGGQPGGPVWTARFGSVTFNQFGRDNPMGGMNTAGLVVELMWLDDTKYPAPDARAPLGVLEWIQYQLDTAASVDDVLAAETKVRISGQAPLHYLVSDRAGRTAAIEYLGGRLVAHHGDALPIPVLTNSTYRDSLAFVEARGARVPGGPGSLERFARASAGLTKLRKDLPSDPVAAAFDVLRSVAQANTRWTILYDQTRGTVHFRTATHAPIRVVKLRGLDFSCRGGVRMLDLDTRLSGEVTARLQPYSSPVHLAMLRRTYASSSVTRGTPDGQVREIATRPEESSCAAGS